MAHRSSKEQVYEYLEQITKEFDFEHLTRYTTLDICNKLNMSRSLVMVVVENVQDAYDLVKACERIKSVNLGGSKIEENRRKLDTAFYVDDNDCRLLGELLDHGIELEIRQVPEEKKKIVTKDMLS